MSTDGAEGPPGHDRNSELSRLVALLTQFGPNVNEVAAKLGVYKETARYWYKHFLVERRISLRAVPNYRKLGLDRLIVIASFPPSFQPHAKTIFSLLHECCYLKEVEQIPVEGRFIIHVAVPAELAETCADLFRKLERMEVLSRLEIHRFSWVRTPPMMSDHYDFRKGVWTYDWPAHRKVPLVPVPDMEKERYDKADLLILSELQEDPSRSLREMAHRFRIGYRKLVWHHRKHVRGQGLIDGYALDWRAAQPSGEHGSGNRYLPIRVILSGADEGTRIRLTALMQRLPFLWFEASGSEDYFASLYLPLETFNEFLSRLKSLQTHEPTLRFFITDQTSAEDYGVSYHLFHGPSKEWQLDEPDVIKKFENLKVQVKSP